MDDYELVIDRLPDGSLLLRLAGDWKLGDMLPEPDAVPEGGPVVAVLRFAG